MNRTAVLYALSSAALFGVSTPAAKSLVGTIDPIVLAGLLYCGAGIGVAMLRQLTPAAWNVSAQGQSLRRQRRGAGLLMSAIGTKRTSQPNRLMSAFGGKADIAKTGAMSANDP
jgi:hypothetical protein